MRFRYSVVTIACSVLLAGIAIAGDSPSTESQLPQVQQIDERRPVGQEASSEIMECRNIRITGSRQRKKSCHTRGEWAAMRRNATDAVRITQQTVTMHFENEELPAARTVLGGD